MYRTAGDQVFEFRATIDREKNVNVASTNVLLADSSYWMRRKRSCVA